VEICYSDSVAMKSLVSRRKVGGGPESRERQQNAVAGLVRAGKGILEEVMQWYS
jgi:hypothetical protein